MTKGQLRPTKYVHYNDNYVIIYWGYFPHILVFLGQRILLIIPRTFTALYTCTFNLLLIIINRYGRAEVLAGFVNGLFLVFIAFFILSEAVEVLN